MTEDFHYFNAPLPTIPEGEPEIFFPHPTLNLKCNQLGVIYFGDEYVDQSYSTVTEKWTFSKGQKEGLKQMPRIRLIRECYLGTENRTYGYSYTLNGNTQDLTFHNVILTSKELKAAKLATERYIKRTVDYMIKRDVQIEERGLDTQQYWSKLKLPSYITKRYTQFTGKLVHTNSRGEYTTGTKSKRVPKTNYKTKLEIFETVTKVKKLVFEEKKTITEAAKILNIGYQMASYYLKRNEDNI